MRGSPRDRGIITALAVTDAADLWFGRPQVRTLAAGLAHPHRWVATAGSDRAAAMLAQTGLWLCAIWVAAALLSVTASRLPGVAGQLASAVAGRAVPAVLRRSIAGAVGASIFLAPLAAGAATPDRGSAPPAAEVSMSASMSASMSVSRSVSTMASANATPISAPTLEPPPAPSDAGSWAWPTSPPTSTHTDGDPVPSPVPWPQNPPNHSLPGEVVVHQGDSLWAIAAHRLGPQANPHEIAAASKRWYEANKPTIGADPSLIHPGQHLHEPTEKGDRS